MGGQPLALEVFDHPRTLGEQYRPLLRAAVLDSLDVPAASTPGRRARRFVARAERVLRQQAPTAGRTDGVEGCVRIADPILDARVLVGAATTVHLRCTHLRHPLLLAA
nr:hypothetical protein [Nocardioides sambongensis]